MIFELVSKKEIVVFVISFSKSFDGAELKW